MMSARAIAILTTLLLAFTAPITYAQTRPSWSQIRNTPTTIDGYGVTDALKTDLSNAVRDPDPDGVLILKDSLDIRFVDIKEVPVNASYTTITEWKQYGVDLSPNENTEIVSQLTRDDRTFIELQPNDPTIEYWLQLGSLAVIGEGRQCAGTVYAELARNIDVNVISSESLTINIIEGGSTLPGLMEKNFLNLTNKPTNASYTLAGLSEKDFSSLTGTPTTYTGYGLLEGVRLNLGNFKNLHLDQTGLQELRDAISLPSRDYDNLINKPTNASYTLAGLSERSWYSLTNKPDNYGGYGLVEGIRLDLSNFENSLLDHTGLQELRSAIGVSSESQVIDAKRWGIRIAKDVWLDNTEYRVTYMYDAVGMKPAKMDFTNGVFDYGDWEGFCIEYNDPVILSASYGTPPNHLLLDRNDHTKRIRGEDSKLDDGTKRTAMSRFKLLWLKQWEDEYYHYIVFSNKKIDGSYRADAFTNSSGEIQDAMYYAMYEGVIIDDLMYSMATGTIATNKSSEYYISSAQNQGRGWGITYKSQRDFITYLHWLISKSNDEKRAFGNGNTSSFSKLAPGTLIKKGQFFGYNDSDKAVKTFFIENFWGNCWKRCDGLYASIHRDLYVKMTPPYSLPPIDRHAPIDYIDTQLTIDTSEGLFLRHAHTSADYGFLPLDGYILAKGYFACGITPPSLYGETGMALVGGSYVSGESCGAVAMDFSGWLSTPSSTTCAALSYIYDPAP